MFCLLAQDMELLIHGTHIMEEVLSNVQEIGVGGAAQCSMFFIINKADKNENPKISK